jgi:uncharacterized damage-inducible protein DinB
MNSKLNTLFNSLEEDRKNLLATVSNLSLEKQLNAPPGKWSIQQILAHLIAAEKLSVMYLHKKMLGIKEAENTGLWEEIKMMALQASQRLPLKFKAPRMVVENTPAYASFEELTADWDKTRAELKVLLEKFEDSQIRKKIYKHIRAGRLNIQHALLFFREHIIHHRPQINRLMKLS